MDGYNENRDRQSMQDWASLFNNMKNGVQSGAGSAWEAVKDGFSKIPSPADNMRRIAGNTSQAGVPQGSTFSGEDPVNPYSVAMPYDRENFVEQMQAPDTQDQLSRISSGAPANKKQRGLPASNNGSPVDPTYANLLKQMYDKGNSTAELQRGAADDMQPFVDQMSQGNLQYDLKPLMSLIDTRTGSNLAQSYKSPEDGKDRVNDLMKLKGNLSQMGIQASDTELQALKDYATGTMGLDNFNAGQDYKNKSLAVQQEQNSINRGKLAAGPKGIDPYQGYQMRSSFTKLEPATQARGVTGFVEALNEYETAMNNFDGNPASPTAASVRSAYTKMSTRFKEAEKLGALAGPDLELLKQNVANGGTWENFAFGGAKGGKAGIRAAIVQTRRGAENDFNLAMKNLNGVAGEAIPVLQPVLDDYQRSYDKASGRKTSGPQAGGTGLAPSVTQNGHTYYLNEQTGEYE